MKIGLKLIIIISIVNLAGIGFLTVEAVLFSSNAIRDVSDLNARRETEVTAGVVKSYLEVPFDEIRMIAYLLEEFDRLVPASERREMVDFYLETFITHNSEFVGVWAIYEPNMLDGNDAAFVNTPRSDATGRFISYWTNERGRISVTPLTNYVNADYYTIPLRTGREAVAEPYYEIVGGNRTLITTVAVPIMRDGRPIGVAGVDIELTVLQEMIETIRPFGTGIAGIYSPNGMVVTSGDASKMGRMIRDVSANMYMHNMDRLLTALREGTVFNDTFHSNEHGTRIIVITSPVFIGGDPTPWSAVTVVTERTVMGAVTAMIRTLILIGVAVLLVTTVVIVIVSRSITLPLKKMEYVFEFIGNGDFTQKTEAKGNDEIGNIGRALNITLDKIKALIHSIKSNADILSEIGTNLTSNMTETAAAVNEITANIQSIKGRTINQSASVTETNATMEQITVNISKLNEQVDKQAQSVSQSSSAIEEMLANIQSVTQTLVKNMENVSRLNEASAVGRSGIHEVSTDIQEISKESEGLLEINAVMNNIAAQTNLLSMNAAIEAAHAGEAGKGFAVVADEIRKLAVNSSEQSKTINTVLKKIKESIDKIGRSTNDVLLKFDAIEENIRTVSDQEESIRNAMEEQQQGSKQILDAIGSLNDLTRQVKSGSHEMREGSSEVIKEGKNLEIITQEITGGMNEMAIGADQINIAVNEVNNITVKNHESIGVLMKEISKFKVD